MKHLLLTTIAAVLLVGCGQDPEGALRSAALDGNIGAVKRHLAAGTDVNAKNTYGWTPLYWASSRGHKEVVELLIANGAYVNPTSDRGVTPLDGAIEYKHSEIADLLRKHGGKTRKELEAVAKAPNISIHDTAFDGDIEAVKQHLATGVDVNVKDDGGMAPLHYAARDGQKEIAELLIAEDAGVNAKANDGTTPLDWAVAWDEPEIADLLRKHGGKRGVKN